MPIFANRCCLLTALLIAPASFSNATPFTNPLRPTGADPWIITHNGDYFYIRSIENRIDIFKTKTLAGLKDAEAKSVWQPPKKGSYSQGVWAPELHFIRDKWYIYVSADAGKNESHRVWVLENASPDPQQGNWTMKGKLTSPDDHWAIDGSVFENRGQLYTIWSGWDGEKNGKQNIYIALMSDPWTISGKRVLVSTPTLPWETVGDTDPEKMPGDPRHIDVNEGPEMLVHGDKLFLIYSASGCWTDHYALGMLTASNDSNLLDPASWKKSPEPMLSTLPEAQAYSTGHCGFFKSPDGKEDWIVYHANPKANQSCGSFRSPRAQKISWKSDGTPDFGPPIPLGREIDGPSGEPAR